MVFSKKFCMIVFKCDATDLQKQAEFEKSSMKKIHCFSFFYTKFQIDKIFAVAVVVRPIYDLILLEIHPILTCDFHRTYINISRMIDAFQFSYSAKKGSWENFRTVI